LKDSVSSQELQYLFNDVENFVLYLVKDPLVKFAGREDSGILQVDQMTGSFGLSKFENVFQIGNAHFSVHHDQIKDTQPGGVRTG